MNVLHLYKDFFPVLGGIENHIGDGPAFGWGWQTLCDDLSQRHCAAKDIGNCLYPSVTLGFATGRFIRSFRSKG